jgi:hypothetical protein
VSILPYVRCLVNWAAFWFLPVDASNQPGG